MVIEQLILTSNSVYYSIIFYLKLKVIFLRTLKCCQQTDVIRSWQFFTRIRFQKNYTTILNANLLENILMPTRYLNDYRWQIFPNISLSLELFVTGYSYDLYFLDFKDIIKPDPTSLRNLFLVYKSCSLCIRNITGSSLTKADECFSNESLKKT